MELTELYLDIHKPLNAYQECVQRFLKSQPKPKYLAKLEEKLKENSYRNRYIQLARGSGKTGFHQELADFYHHNIFEAIQHQRAKEIEQQIHKELLSMADRAFDSFDFEPSGSRHVERRPLPLPDFRQEIMGTWIGGDTDGDYR